MGRNKKKQNEQLQAKEQEIDTLKTQLLAVQTMEFEEKERYKQALDEVEKMCKDHPFCDCSCGQDILDIINKAKGEKK